MSNVSNIPSWEEITKSSHFKSLSDDNKRSTTDQYLDKFVDGEYYRSLSSEDRVAIRDKHYDLAEIVPDNYIGPFQNFLNSAIKTATFDRGSNLAGLAGYFDASEQAKKSGQEYFPTEEGISSIAGSAIGSAAPFAVGLGTTLINPPLGAAILISLAAEQGLQEAGVARELVKEKREEGQEISDTEEISLAVGHGSIAMALNLVSGIAGRNILKAGQPQIRKIIQGLATKPAATIKEFGEAFIAKDSVKLASIISKNALVEGIQEPTEGVLRNLMTNLIDPNHPVWDDAVNDAIGGAFGGAFIGSTAGGVRLYKNSELHAFRASRDEAKKIIKDADKAQIEDIQETINLGVNVDEGLQSQFIIAQNNFIDSAEAISQKKSVVDINTGEIANYHRYKSNLQRLWNDLNPEDESGDRFQEYLDDNLFNLVEDDMKASIEERYSIKVPKEVTPEIVPVTAETLPEITVEGIKKSNEEKRQGTAKKSSDLLKRGKQVASSLTEVLKSESEKYRYSDNTIPEIEKLKVDENYITNNDKINYKGINISFIGKIPEVNMDRFMTALNVIMESNNELFTGVKSISLYSQSIYRLRHSKRDFFNFLKDNNTYVPYESAFKADTYGFAVKSSEGGIRDKIFVSSLKNAKTSHYVEVITHESLHTIEPFVEEDSIRRSGRTVKTAFEGVAGKLQFLDLGASKDVTEKVIPDITYAVSEGIEAASNIKKTLNAEPNKYRYSNNTIPELEKLKDGNFYVTNNDRIKYKNIDINFLGDIPAINVDRFMTAINVMVGTNPKLFLNTSGIYIYTNSTYILRKTYDDFYDFVGMNKDIKKSDFTDNLIGFAKLPDKIFILSASTYKTSHYIELLSHEAIHILEPYAEERFVLEAGFKVKKEFEDVAGDLQFQQRPEKPDYNIPGLFPRRVSDEVLQAEQNTFLKVTDIISSLRDILKSKPGKYRYSDNTIPELEKFRENNFYVTDNNKINYKGLNISFMGNIPAREVDRFMTSINVIMDISPKLFLNVNSVYFYSTSIYSDRYRNKRFFSFLEDNISEDIEQDFFVDNIRGFIIPDTLGTSHKIFISSYLQSLEFKTSEYINTIVHEVLHANDLLVGEEVITESGEDIKRAFESVAGDLQFQQKEVIKEPTLKQLHRLLAPLQKAEIFTKIVRSPVIINEAGQHVNAAIDDKTGVLYISHTLDLSTIGHEAMHRLMGQLGEGDPLIQEGLDLFDGDLEKLNDAVGDYYAGVTLEKGIGRKLSRWLSNVRDTVKVKFGKKANQNDIVRMLNKKIHSTALSNLERSVRTRSKLTDEIEEASRIDAVRGKDIDEKFEELKVPVKKQSTRRTEEEEKRLKEGFNTSRINLAKEIENIIQIDYADYSKTEDSVYSNHELALDINNFMLAQGHEGMDKLLTRYLEDKTIGLNNIESFALRAYALGESAKLIHDLLNTEFTDETAREFTWETLKQIQRGVVYPLSKSTGQALQAYNLIVNPLEQFTGKLIQFYKEGRKFTKQEEEFLATILTDNKIKDPRIAKAALLYFTEPSKGDLIQSLFINNILWNPKIHVENLLTNGMWLFFQLAAKGPVEAGLGTFLNKFIPAKFGTYKTNKTMTESLPGLFQMFDKKTQYKALKSAGDVFIKGPIFSLTEFEFSKFAIDLGTSIEAFARSRNPIIRSIGRVVGLSSRGLFAVDIYFKTLAYDATLKAIADRKGITDIVKIRDFLRNPDPESDQEAKDFASLITFTNKLGFVGELAQTARRDDRTKFVVATVIPFVTAVSNLLKRRIELTPVLGLAALAPKFNKPAKSGQSRIEMEDFAKFKEGEYLIPQPEKKIEARDSVAGVLSNQILGSSFLAMMLLIIDDITGAVPEDPEEKDIFFASGKIPYAVKINGYWISFNQIPPFGGILNVVASIKEGIENYKERDELSLDPDIINNLSETFLDVAGSLSSGMLQSTWTRNLTGWFDRRGERLGEKAVSYAGRTSSTLLIPMAGFWKNIKKVFEGYSYGEERLNEYNVFLSEWSNTIPWSNEIIKEVWGDEYELNRRINVLGEEVSIEGGALRQWLPYKWQEASGEDSVESELDRLGFYPALPHRTINLKGYGNKEIPNQKNEYYEYCLAYGVATKRGLKQVMELKAYDKAIDKVKEIMLRKSIDLHRRPVQKKMRAEMYKILKLKEKLFQ